MTRTITQDMEGKKSFPVIRYFKRILANTISGRGDNGSVYMKELFFIDCVLKHSQIISPSFMLAHLKTVVKTR